MRNAGYSVFIAPTPCDVARISYYGLYALQHRGQESAGIVVNDDGVFVSHKDLGLVSEVFSNEILSGLPQGTMAVAHTRYGTTGGTNRNNCQPIEVNHQKGRMALAHNGNLSNSAELRSALELAAQFSIPPAIQKRLLILSPESGCARLPLRMPSVRQCMPFDGA